jgi:hypothetical protein
MVRTNVRRGRAIAQVTSRRLPTETAQVRTRVSSCEIFGGQSGTGIFSEYFGFPIPPIAPQSSASIIWGGYNRPIVAAVPSGLSLTPPQEIKK